VGTLSYCAYDKVTLCNDTMLMQTHCSVAVKLILIWSPINLTLIHSLQYWLGLLRHMKKQRWRKQGSILHKCRKPVLYPSDISHKSKNETNIDLNQCFSKWVESPPWVRFWMARGRQGGETTWRGQNAQPLIDHWV